MASISMQELHDDLEIVKRDLAELKQALLGDEGELTPWARRRIEQAMKAPPSRYRSLDVVKVELLS